MNTDEKIQKLEQFNSEVRKSDKSTNCEELALLRSSINRNKKIVCALIEEAECRKFLNIYPPPAVGGYVMQNADPFDLIFDQPYGQDMICPVTDMVDEAIGVFMNPTKAQKLEDTIGECQKSYRR